MKNFIAGLNSFLADTLGVVYRALTGRVDPWTAQEVKKINNG